MTGRNFRTISEFLKELLDAFVEESTIYFLKKALKTIEGITGGMDKIWVPKQKKISTA